MKEIIFYKTKSGKYSIDDFIDSLSIKDTEKVLWVLKLVRESKILSTKYYKKLGNNNFRLLGFEYEDSIIILTNGFRKKDQKVPRSEIRLAQKRKEEYLNG